ncbi:MAG: hypothetical protein ACFE0O_03120 [Opitutales bacterium]
MPLLARHNPFRTSRLDRLPVEIAPEAWAWFTAAVGARQGRGAFIGPKGSGKSTWLKAWRDHCIQVGDTVYSDKLRDESSARELCRLFRRVAALPADTWLLIDGGERLGPLADGWLCRILRPRGRLLMTRHTPGNLPALPYAPATFEQARRWVDHLLGGNPEGLASLPDLQACWARNPGDARALFEACYLGLAQGESIVISGPNPFARPPCRNY